MFKPDIDEVCGKRKIRFPGVVKETVSFSVVDRVVVALGEEAEAPCLGQLHTMQDRDVTAHNLRKISGMMPSGMDFMPYSSLPENAS